VYECTGRKVSMSTICRVIHKNGLTRKKIQCIAAQRNAKFRGDYVAETLMYNVNMFVFTDETGKDKHVEDMGMQYKVQHHNQHFSSQREVGYQLLLLFLVLD